MQPAADAVQHDFKGRSFWVGRIAGDHDSCGLRWFVKVPSSDGRTDMFRVSSGAFYDGVPEHPEGAEIWAEVSCRQYLANTVTR